jgi:hypothetical protein
MFQICQNDTNGLDGGGIRIHGDVSTKMGRIGVLCAPDAR